MGEKADKLNQELVPTRSLLRWLADQVGVTINEDITSIVLHARYMRLLDQALRSGAPRHPYMPSPEPRESPPAFDRMVDDEVTNAAETALVHQPDTAAPMVDKGAFILAIAKELGLDAEGLDEGTVLASIHAEILSIKAPGGDVEIPKGDSLAQAVKFGHDQNHELRERLRDAELLIQRVAGALQVTLTKGGDGSEVLEAVQRFEVAKVMMRRQIVDLRGGGHSHARRFPGAPANDAMLRHMADALESHFVRMLSSAELSEWNKGKGATVTPRVPEHPPHPFKFTRPDIDRLCEVLEYRVLEHPMRDPSEVNTLNSMLDVFKEILLSSSASSQFLACMETTLAILARERAGRLKE